MRLLLDTCVLLWLAADPERLSLPSREALDDPENDLCVSHASVWEIALKTAAGRLALPMPPRAWLARQQEAWGFSYHAISLEHLLRTGELHRHHADPFDRLIICQAIVDGFAVVTPDEAIARYPVQVLW